MDLGKIKWTKVPECEICKTQIRVRRVYDKVTKKPKFIEGCFCQKHSEIAGHDTVIGYLAILKEEQRD